MTDEEALRQLEQINMGSLVAKASLAIGKNYLVGGSVNHPLYGTWGNMHSRCKDLDNESYGGAGVTVCKRWSGKKGFLNFLSDMGDKPSKEYSIDRINPFGNYEPSNCKWSTPKEQANNKRNNWKGEH